MRHRLLSLGRWRFLCSETQPKGNVNDSAYLRCGFCVRLLGCALFCGVSVNAQQYLKVKNDTAGNWNRLKVVQQSTSASLTVAQFDAANGSFKYNVSAGSEQNFGGIITQAYLWFGYVCEGDGDHDFSYLAGPFQRDTDATINGCEYNDAYPTSTENYATISTDACGADPEYYTIRKTVTNTGNTIAEYLVDVGSNGTWDDGFTLAPGQTYTFEFQSPEPVSIDIAVARRGPNGEVLVGPAESMNIPITDSGWTAEPETPPTGNIYYGYTSPQETKSSTNPSITYGTGTTASTDETLKTGFAAVRDAVLDSGQSVQNAVVSRITSVESAVNAVNSSVGGLGTSLSGIQGAINTLNGTVSTGNSKLDAIKGAIDGQGEDLDAIGESLDGIEGALEGDGAQTDQQKAAAATGQTASDSGEASFDSIEGTAGGIGGSRTMSYNEPSLSVNIPGVGAMDVNPLHNETIAAIADWAYGLAVFVISFLLFKGCWSDTRDSMGWGNLTPQGTAASYVPVASSGTALAMAAVVVGALVAIPAVFLTLVGSGVFGEGGLFSNPFAGQSGVVAGGLWVLGEVFPVMWALSCAVVRLTFSISITGVQYVVSSVIRFAVG